MLRYFSDNGFRGDEQEETQGGKKNTILARSLLSGSPGFGTPFSVDSHSLTPENNEKSRPAGSPSILPCGPAWRLA